MEKCTEGRKHTWNTTSSMIDPNQAGDPEGQPDSRSTAGRSGAERIRFSLGFIAVLEQSAGGCLNWGKRKVIKRGNY